MMAPSHHLALTVLAVAACLLTTTCAQPEQVHIAFAGQDANGYPTGVSVTWYTANVTSTSIVRYGTLASGSLTSQASATTAPQSYLDGHGFHHVVRVLNLQPATEYMYQVGDQTDGWSDTFVFRSAPATSDVPVSFALFGDMGYLGSAERPMVVATGGLQKNWSAVPVRTLLESLKDTKAIDFIWHLGDIGYADDAFSHAPLKFGYESAYNGYMNWIQNLTATMPYMVSVGNHESECHSPACVADTKIGNALRNFSAYNTRWHMPSEDSKGVLNMWYSWNYGPVHFISLNTETDFPGAGEENTGDSHDPFMPAGHFAPDGTYLAWLEQELAAAHANRAQRPWIIAGGHRPFPDIAANGVQELFERYEVDVYVAGHTHSYSRSMPGNLNGSSYHNLNGTVLVVAGGTGCEEMHDVGAPDPATFRMSSLHTEVFATDRVAAGVLMVNSTYLNFRLLSGYNHAEVLDEFTLTRSS
ncbi:uncharacterized protein MONBRDRAFT_25809 [Monosiga brevicollis MX1]|uniref:Purple acid phosphatase n=1 Tax=Monosiga brevicollis TaxID=81824 RepID=A9V0H8_MONBE|nr:uncharacterized protein MONBRDRAFT_25809 [Monosiga brevicollis MX1]EDQ89016.1 predicted protein [Monosiga brevicollis MX1]|eukprot:XP_001746121.1 hypothetical protein [Monosiga brevicollis MX1]